MRIGIIGAGNIGGTLGRLWAGAGHEVLFSFSRDPAKLADLAFSLGPLASAGSPGDAVGFGEVVVISVPWPVVVQALDAAGAGDGRLGGRVLIDTTNALGASSLPPLDPPVVSSSAYVAAKAPGARVVKAVNTLYFVTLGHKARAEGGRLGLPLSGDDQDARTLVAGLVTDAGYDPVDLGPLSEAWRQEPTSPIYNKELGADEIRAQLEALTP